MKNLELVRIYKNLRATYPAAAALRIAKDMHAFNVMYFKSGSPFCYTGK